MQRFPLLLIAALLMATMMLTAQTQPVPIVPDLHQLDQAVKASKKHPELQALKAKCDSLQQLLESVHFGKTALKADAQNKAIFHDTTGGRYERKVLMIGPDGNYVSDDNQLLLRIPFGLLTENRLSLIKQFVQMWSSLDQTLSDQIKLLQLQREVK
jgi:hypothetical protein